MTSTEIRQSFLGFFKSKGHTIVPSSSLLPDAPNLLFTNAGMNQFVPIFLGQQRCPYSPPRAADTQKCIRAGGKHNDLEDVGLDTYHHTFFEMLGNWSFGDYFKREAIEWAWELITEKWKFPKDRLYATVYCPHMNRAIWEHEMRTLKNLYEGGGEIINGDRYRDIFMKAAAEGKEPFAGLITVEHSDMEAGQFWYRLFRNAGLDPLVHIIPGNKKDNFWMMGDTGPCGPCSEIHVDLTPRGDTKGALVNKGSPQCMEIWNLVFIQFNAEADGTFNPLPARHVDTGMGFERVCGIMQCTKNFTDFTGTISNYETDVFAPLFRELERLSGKKYTSTLPNAQAETPVPPTNRNQKDGGTGVPACDSEKKGVTGFKETRRNLPHLQDAGRTYFITFRTHQNKVLTEPMCDIVLSACRHRHDQKYHLYAITVMPDHIHLLLWPKPIDPTSQQTISEKGFHDLSEILHSIKSFTANQIQRRCGWTGSVWMDEHFDRMVRDEAEFLEKWNYIAQNAVRKTLAAASEEYKWFWNSGEHFSSQGTQAGTPVPPNLQEPASRIQNGGTGVPACGSEEQIATDIAFRVIADHIRTLSFSIADGIIPSNEGRGYVLRRILRRAVRYGRNLGFHEPFFFKLVDVLAQTMGEAFPEIRRHKDKLQTTLRAEEESFNRTLDRGIALFEEVVASLKATVFPAEEAFKLYDTYGFPLDLTELMARERGLTVDVTGFEQLMEEQRRRAREDYAKKKSAVKVVSEGLEVESTKFLGYENLESEAVVEAVSPSEKESEFKIILDRTPFYAESGGQVGDTGLVHVPGHERTEIGKLAVQDTQKDGAVFVHRAKLAEGRAPEIGEAVRVAVDKARRLNIQKHHTVTHLFHWALHEVVSRDARQRGSLVAADRMRFDFNNHEGLTDAQIADIERLVNERIKDNAPVFWFEVPYREVQKRPDVMQMFGEKYGDVVRVVQIGGHEKAFDGFSVELCGGTHTRTTGEIGLFKIMRESAIAAGIRRVEAATGESALAFIEKLKAERQKQVELEKARELEKQLAKQREADAKREASAMAEELATKAERREGLPPLIVVNLGEHDAEFVRAAAEAVRAKLKSGVAVFGAAKDGKVSFAAFATPDQVKAGQHAGNLLRELAKICGGGGGGKPDFAQAGGKDASKLAEALAAVPRFLKKA
jgi:alanine--tRNA ligase